VLNATAVNARQPRAQGNCCRPVYLRNKCSIGEWYSIIGKKESLPGGRRIMNSESATNLRPLIMPDINDMVFHKKGEGTGYCSTG